MEVGCRGSYPLATACAADLAFLRQAGRTELWMDPNDTDAAAARNVVASQLRELGILDSNAAATRTRGFYDVKARVYAPVGWLSLSPAGQWQCLSRQPPAGSGRLYVVRRASGQGVELISVGEYEAGRIRLPPGTTGGPQAGRPVTPRCHSARPGIEELHL